MDFNTDENLQLYVEESLEHLSDIENDLLAIEEDGADIDEELVNKVFRAAHSIKGGAGFMGLTNIKELSHKMENVLGMIRSREMIPNPEIINILLLASDSLRNLVSDSAASNDIDISEHITALTAVAENNLPEEEKESISNIVDITTLDGKTIFGVTEFDITSAKKEGKFIYLVEYDLINDVHKKDKTPMELLNEMEQSGIIMECKIDTEAIGSLDSDVISKRIPFLVLFGTILEPEMINALFQVEDEFISQMGEDQKLRRIGELPEEVPSGEKEEEIKGSDTEPEPEEEVVAEEKPVVAQKEAQPKKAKAPGKKDEKPPKASVTTETSLRVNVSLLDSLMNLAGELVLGRNQLLQSITSRDQRTIESSGQRLDLITTELQEAIMLTRMQAIGSVFNKFPRVVRDLARNLDKEIDLILEGKDVELDKTIIEAISDPLTHLVRNSVDHGIESPEERKNQGKNPTGKVLLKAYHEAGQVNIEITDDGKGLDGEKLAASAIAKDLLKEDEVRVMSDKEKVNLIFLPGFSTAQKVTDVSGRGVGMDVVKTNLDKLGGVVDIESQVGEGTTIRVKLPLTLAIIPSQLISTGGERFAIPQVNMDELLRIPAAQVKDRIERVGEAEVVRLRGKLLPLISLAQVLGMENTYTDPKDGEEKTDRRKGLADRRCKRSPLFDGLAPDGAQVEDDQSPIDSEAQPESAENNGAVVEYDRREDQDRRYRADSAVNIVVVSAGALKYGLVVNKLFDSEEIVVKPLGRHLKHCKGYAGATIMGDGHVALILDVVGISQMAELTSIEGTDRAGEMATEAIKKNSDEQSLLIFRNAEEEQFAVPLGLVQRIEKIKRDDIEIVGGKRVIKYRGGSLPLAAIEEVADVKPTADKDDLMVIVFLMAEREAGLIGTGPVDAVEVDVKFDETILNQPGIVGSAIIGENTTLLIDVFGLMKILNPQWFTEREVVQSSDGNAATILYAEDSHFFRSQVKGFMEEEGYKVIEAEDGVKAWEQLEQCGEEVSIVVTDIEMPEMDGYELTKMIKRDERFRHLPVIALTTLAGEEDMARGKEVGIDEYQIKLDRERLGNSIHTYLKNYTG